LILQLSNFGPSGSYSELKKIYKITLLAEVFEWVIGPPQGPPSAENTQNRITWLTPMHQAEFEIVVPVYERPKIACASRQIVLYDQYVTLFRASVAVE
jgi:hypothetical protein